MAVVRGKDFKLYYNDDAYETPDWVLIANIKDLTRTLEKTLADASTRGSSFRQQVGTMKDLTIEFQMVYDPADDAFELLEESFFDDTQIDFLILDGEEDEPGSKGIRFLGEVTNFTNNEALEDVGLTDVTIVPAYAPATPPIQFTVPPGD